MDKIIEEYITNVQMIRMSLDELGDNKKVRQTNKIGAKIIKIVEMIEEADADTKKQFIDLMDSEDEDLKSRVAHHILERMHVDKSIRLKALSIIKEKIENTQDPTDRMGNQIWLKDYYRNHPEDQE
jgi:hypothetical protein